MRGPPSVSLKSFLPPKAWDSVNRTKDSFPCMSPPHYWPVRKWPSHEWLNLYLVPIYTVLGNEVKTEAQQSHFKHVISFLLRISPGVLVFCLNTCNGVVDRDISEVVFLSPQLSYTLSSLEKLQMIACCAKWTLHASEWRTDNYLVEVCLKICQFSPWSLWMCCW